MERKKIAELIDSEFASLPKASIAPCAGSVPGSFIFASKSSRPHDGCLAPRAGSVPGSFDFASKSSRPHGGCLVPRAGSVPGSFDLASKSSRLREGCLAPRVGSVPNVCGFLLAIIVAFFSQDAQALEKPNSNTLPESTAHQPQQNFKFELDIQPILTARGCNSGPCHGKSRGQNGFALSLLGFDSDMDFRSIVTDARGRRVQPASPADSLLLQKATAHLPHGGGKKLEPDSPDYHTLFQWIQSGFPRTSDADPVLTQVSISPEPKPLAPGEELNLKVSATYSDGSVRDVTSTSAYQSNEPAVLAVKPDGKIKAGSL
ncbi:MAG: hypothetical protein RJB11_775, partial [Planctomycetota bacterium]